MSHDSRAVANFFIEKADVNGKPITPMQVIKLVYFAHGWCLGIFDAPLVNDEVEAWDYGPVIRPVYDAFKRFGNQPITDLAREEHFLPFHMKEAAPPIRSIFSKREIQLLDKVWDIYGNLKGFQLSAITHRDDTPWFKIFKEHGRNSVIPDRDIADYFKQLGARNAEKTKQAGANSAS